MRNGIILTSLVLFAVFIVSVWFVFIKNDKKIDLGNENGTPGTISEPLRVYTEEEKIKILKNLAETNVTTQAATGAPVSVETVSSIVSKQEAQKRIQALEQIAQSVDTANPADAEKLRILNSLKSAVQ